MLKKAPLVWHPFHGTGAKLVAGFKPEEYAAAVT